jgi:hypothetical protein
LAIMSSAVMNMKMQLFLLCTVYNDAGCIPRSGIARSYDTSLLNFLRNLPMLSKLSVY